MRNRWIRFGCFLTGFNYGVISACSELSTKRVIKYTSALLIVCLLWSFIGFGFTNRYLKGEWYTNVTASLIMVFLVIQIERQIILSSKDNRLLHLSRLVIALAMALIGTVIIDQILFKDDIAKKQLMTMDIEVNNILPGRASELRKQIEDINKTIGEKENEKKMINDDVAKHPFVTAYESQTQKDTSKNVITTIIRKQVLNPKVNQLEPLERSIIAMRKDKMKKDSLLLGLRPAIESDLKQNVGFLNELHIMYSLLSESGVSLAAWLIWFVFLLGLELFILVSKAGETETDYDRRMKQQMELHFKRIELLNKQA